MALLPAFIVFAWYYFISSDRRVFCYANESKKTSRHYIDIYGSTITGSDWETLSLSCHQYSNISSKSTGRTSPSNSLSSDLSDDIDDIDSQDSIRAKGSGKPIVIFLTGGAWTIGYKMWGALLARALVPMGIIVAIPDYRNFPQTMVDGMIDDVDTAIQWVIDNCECFGGSSRKVVVVGQSAGAHLGSTVLMSKVLDAKIKLNEHRETSWQPADIKGFIAVSGPYDMVRMKEVFHQHGLPRNIVSALFCGNLERYSPVHLARKLKSFESTSKMFPPIAILHGDMDKTVPVVEATNFAAELRKAEINCEVCLYKGWSHTDAILEAPMDGNHKFHLDIFNSVMNWTSPNDDFSSPLKFDLSHPVCRRICPRFLIQLGRWLNPF